jgi:hypothetical protein
MSFVWTDDLTDQMDQAAISFTEDPAFSVDETATPWSFDLEEPDGQTYIDLEDLEAGVGLEDMISPEQGSWDDEDSLDVYVGADAGVLPEDLSGIWSSSPPTTKFHLTPNRDLSQAAYERAPESTLDPAHVLEHIHLAMRLSHKGAPLKTIQAALENNLPTPLAEKALARIAREHGVAGRVFIRAAAFPGIRRGRWDGWLKKHCKTARYVLTPDVRLAQRLGLVAAEDLDWSIVHAEYAPSMRLAGYTLQDGPDHQAALKASFLDGPRSRPVHQPIRAFDVRNTMSFEEARAILAATPPPQQEIFIRDDTRKARQRTLDQLRRAHAQGQLSDDEHLKLSTSQAPPEEVMRTAQRLARLHLKASAQEYKGSKYTAHQQERHAAWADLDKSHFASVLMQRAHNHLIRMVQAGQITQKEADQCATQTSPENVLRYAAAYAHRAKREAIPESQPAKSFEGALVEGHAAHTRKAHKQSPLQEAYATASRDSGIPLKDLHVAATTLRHLMAQGLAGKALTAALNRRVAAPARTALADILASLRRAHEGLSGHLYVDAALFASPTGSSGCERAASTQRANPIPFVKQMSRCASCVFGQSGHCSVFNKRLMTSLPDDAQQRKAAVIRDANAPRKQSTAAGYDPDEFRLGTEMDNIDLQDATSHEVISDITFGGMQL